MRTIFVFAIVLSAAVALMSSDGAEPGQPPGLSGVQPASVVPSTVNELPRGSKPPLVPPSHQAPVYIPAGPHGPEFSYDQISWLQQEFVAMAKKRAERMDGPALKQGISEMRRQWLIAELEALSQESYDARLQCAAEVLKRKDENDLRIWLQAAAKAMKPNEDVKD